MFTQAERDRRLRRADKILKEQGLAFAVLIGNGSVGPGAYGNYRYFVENRVYYHMQALILIQGQEPIVCCGSVTHLDALNSRGFHRVRMCGDRIIENVISALLEQGLCKGRAGFCPDMMPAGWFDALLSAFPEVSFVDLTQALLDLRFDRSQEEIAVLRACAGIADEGYRALLGTVRPGRLEQELNADLDYTLKKNGAEETFTLLTSGDPQGGEMDTLHFAGASRRAVANGECVALEITPRYEGYWTQLVRTICVGTAGERVRRLHGVCTCVIEQAAGMLRPGVRAGDVAWYIFQQTRAAGCSPALPCGHICGVDLNEMRLEPDCDLVLRSGMTVILHPTITGTDGRPVFYWGETYLVTQAGGECLSAAGRDLQIVPVGKGCDEK